ncbi:MAG: molecular chaperone HtpG [Anaerolineae bacterium]
MPDQTQQSYEFRAEIQQLLHILVHSLYTEREIFLRELISNASDALSRVQFEMLTNQSVLDLDAALAVQITFDADARTLTVSDSGIGMTQAEMIENLGTIAHSGAAAFLKQVAQEKRPLTDMIGRFGVGFYAAFMVADRIQVVSRSYRPDAEAAQWSSTGDNQYSVGSAERPARGTDVILHLKEDAAEFVTAWRLEQIIKKHSDFVAFPIYVQDKVANQRTALWRRAPREVTDEEYDTFYEQLTLDFEKPLRHLHYVADAPVDIHAVLFVPRTREKGMMSLRKDFGLKLYSSHVLIQEYNKDLLPNHFRFIEGVLDSEDIPLNVSRETVQANRLLVQIQKALTGRLVKELGALASEKPDDYRAFWQEFGGFIKEGVATDMAGMESLLPLLRFRSTQAPAGDEWVSLAGYVQRMQPEQKEIYYILGEDLTSVQRSPHLDPLKQRHIEVLTLVETVDSFMMVALREFDGKPLRNVDNADLDLPPLPEQTDEPADDAMPDADFDRLLARFTEILGDRVQGVRASKALSSSPCRLVSPEGAMNQEMQRVYKLLDQPFTAPKKVLELNRSHALVQDLAFLVTADRQADLMRLEIEQLYESALLQEGIHPNPAALVAGIQELLGHAAHAARQVEGGAG